MNPSLAGHVVIFRDVSGDAFELRINSGGYQQQKASGITTTATRRA